MTMDLLLASRSPRRQALLAHIAPGYRVETVPVDEAAPQALPPHLAVQTIARKKALAVSRLHPERWVLAADTLVVHEGHLVGKAHDADEERALLADLSGTVHEVHTGLALAWDADIVDDDVARTQIRMDRLPRDVVDAYVKSGDWQGKAGGYGIQDGPMRPYLHIEEGTWSNVVGLPMETTWRLLHRNGVPAREPPPEDWLVEHGL